MRERKRGKKERRKKKRCCESPSGADWQRNPTGTVPQHPPAPGPAGATCRPGEAAAGPGFCPSSQPPSAALRRGAGESGLASTGEGAMSSAEVMALRALYTSGKQRGCPDLPCQSSPSSSRPLQELSEGHRAPWKHSVCGTLGVCPKTTLLPWWVKLKY